MIDSAMQRTVCSGAVDLALRALSRFAPRVLCRIAGLDALPV